MGARILNFPDAMRVAELLERNEMSWMFFDGTIYRENIVTLLVDGMDKEALSSLIHLCLGDDIKINSIQDMLEKFVEVLELSRIYRAIEVYRGLKNNG